MSDGSTSSSLLVDPPYNDSEDDPLGVKKLALSFDYLIYKIGEQMDQLASEVEVCVNIRKQEVDTQMESIEKTMNDLKQLIKSCEDLEMEFVKLEQIGYIVSDFKERIRQLDEYFKKN